VDIVANKALLFKAQNPNIILDTIPKSKAVSDDEVVVYWGIRESQVLNKLGYKKTPSPIKRDYKWQGKFKPFDHQIETSSFLTLHKRACCFNEQGTGKTASVIWAADYLMTIGEVKRVLVICPLSIMSSAWLTDLFSCAMHRTASICHGTHKKRQKILDEGAEFVVINYDGVEIVANEIAKGGFDLIVVDEANAYKNTSTRRWKVLNKLAQQTSYLWMLTGTPASQSPVDAFGLAKLINPENTPRFAGRWREMVMQRVSQFTFIPRPQAKTLVHRVLQPAIRYTKEECLDLPEITYTTREVPLTPQQNKYYKLMRQELIVNAAGEDITMVNAATAMNKLLQLSGGAVYSDEGETISFNVKPRMAVLKEIIEESSQKVIVFVPFRHAIELMGEELKNSNISCEIINGSVNVNKRTDIFKRFQETNNPKVLIIQPQSASHGVTLHRADTVVYWSPVMSVETYLQCNARAHRAGQRNPVTVVHLQGSAVEHKIYKMLQNKVDIHANIINLYKSVA
jgi:SNF2 family DNA or RNA helicase